MSSISDFVDTISKNKALQDFGKKLGIGGKTDAEKEADAKAGIAQAQIDGYSPNSLTRENPQYAQATDQDPSDMNNIALNPAYRGAQTDQLAALANLAKNGGRNAATDANLAQIQQQENANARGNREAILQNAQASGRGGAGSNLIAQLDASQNATNNQSLQDMNVLGQQQNNALNAGTAAAGIGANLENADYTQQSNRAKANDAVNQFNAGQRTGVSTVNAGIGNASQQFNSGLGQIENQNDLQGRMAKAGQNMAGVNYANQVNSTQAQQAGNVAGGVVKLGAAAYGAAGGGRVPGHAVYQGDSRANDFIQVDTSPGEVILPRSLVEHGSDRSILGFVHHPHAIQHTDNRSAQLAALRALRSRRNG